MTVEETRFNNNVIAFMVKNQEYLENKAESGDEQAKELEKTNTSLIDWYKRGNSLPFVAVGMEPDKKKNENRIPNNLKERLRAHEVEIVNCMLDCGFYYPNELHLSGVQRSLNTMFGTVNQNGLINRIDEVKECIKRVQEMDQMGKVKNKQKYLQKSLMNLVK